MSDFDAAFAIVVGLEGDYVNDPQDPGGETKFGISKRAHPNEDIPNLTLDRAKAIYLGTYWQATGCDALKWPMSLYVFDCAVNQGPARAVGFERLADGDAVKFLAERALHYASLSTFARFGRGWMRRLFTLTQDATNAR
jgi:lysozyme family protein